MITEAISIVKAIRIDLFVPWLEYHSKIFNRIHIWNNDSHFYITPYAMEIGNRNDCCIEVEDIYGTPRQYSIYDSWINHHSKADWVMPLDDDEYVIMDSRFKNIEDVINYYKNKFSDMEMFCLKWHHKFPNVFHAERNGESVLSYCQKENYTLASLFPCGDRGVKTIVHRANASKIHYEETVENPNGGHLPKFFSLDNKLKYGRLCNGEVMTGNLVKTKGKIEDELAYLAHYRFTGYSEYFCKIKEREFSISNSKPLKRNIRFNNILELLK